MVLKVVGVRSGQVSMEYLVIFSIAMMLTLPLIVIFVTQTGNIRADITNAEMQKVSQKIIDYADAVYYMGEPSQKTLYINFPEGINSVVVAADSITFNITTVDRNYAVYMESNANLTGSIKNFPGMHVLVFKAENNTVIIADQ